MQQTQSQVTFFKAIFFEVADENGLVYDFSTKKANFQLEKEDARAKFLVKLIENYGFEEDDLRLDFEPLSLEVLGSVDLVGFRRDTPFLACRFLRNDPPFSEVATARETLFNQIKDTKASYGALIFNTKEYFFKKENKKIVEVAPSLFLR
ncbi:MAG: hypothetical protein Q8N55_03240 [bacterium]|nr:hypothetical protein [bacterium]